MPDSAVSCDARIPGSVASVSLLEVHLPTLTAAKSPPIVSTHPLAPLYDGTQTFSMRQASMMKCLWYDFSDIADYRGLLSLLSWSLVRVLRSGHG